MQRDPFSQHYDTEDSESEAENKPDNEDGDAENNSDGEDLANEKPEDDKSEDENPEDEGSSVSSSGSELFKQRNKKQKVDPED